MRVLIAEDDLRIADLLQCGLQEEGYQVTTETDGKRALGMASALYKDSEPWGVYIGNPPKKLGKPSYETY